jgi:hypothetical protein
MSKIPPKKLLPLVIFMGDRCNLWFSDSKFRIETSPMAANSPSRRWPRQAVDLPVRVGIYRDSETVLVPGLVTELSEGGMSLYAGMWLKPGDLLEVEFQMPVARTVQAVVRNKTGFNFGLEFIETLRG